MIDPVWNANVPSLRGYMVSGVNVPLKSFSRRVFLAEKGGRVRGEACTESLLKEKDDRRAVQENIRSSSSLMFQPGGGVVAPLPFLF